MSFLRLLLRNLIGRRRAHLAVAAATGVGVAVLTGSLLVGNSVRASLRAQTLDRLGEVRWVAAPQAFLPQTHFSGVGAEPAILLDAAVSDARLGTVAGDAHVLGVDASFWSLEEDAFRPDWGRLGSYDCALNQALAREIQARVGDDVIVRFQKPSDMPRQSFMGEREDVVATMRLTVRAVLAEDSLADFGMTPSRQAPKNVFVPLAALQQAAGREETVNLALSAVQPERGIVWRPEDLGLRRRVQDGFSLIESVRMFLRPEAVRVVESEQMRNDRRLREWYADLKSEGRAPTSASLSNAPPASLDVLAYLVNRIEIVGRPEASIPYSTGAGLALGDAATSAGLVRGRPTGFAPEAGNAEIVYLNAWAAQELKARPGEEVRLTYFVDAPGGGLMETSATLRLAGVLAMDDPLLSEMLVPEYPGVSDAETMASWDAPFPIDYGRIRPEDDGYWQRWRTTPKVLLPLGTAQRLWTPPGAARETLTGAGVVALGAGAPREALHLDLDVGLLEEALRIDFRNVREERLRASRGNSSFEALFIGFSLFLLVSAASLIQILFRLGVEARAREIGLYKAIGFNVWAVRRLLLAEGLVVAAAGAAFGALLAEGYGRLMVHGLNTWWSGAVGGSFLRFATSVPMHFAGAAGGSAVALVSIFFALRTETRRPAAELLAGAAEEFAQRRAPRIRWAVLAGLVAAGLLGASAAAGDDSRAAFFFSGGAIFLAATLLGFRVWLRGAKPPSEREGLTLLRLGLNAARRNPSRSLLVTVLIGSATFLIVSVGANRHTGVDETGLHSGTGGFELSAESAIPLHRPLREIFREAGGDPTVLEGVEVFAFRLKPGDDASCLNLYQATAPRILGYSDAFARRGGFNFGATIPPVEVNGANPWDALSRLGRGKWSLSSSPPTQSVLPVFGDENSVVWLLHSGLGKRIPMQEGPALLVAGLLKRSIFQSEMLMPEDVFQGAFPEYEGMRFFLFDISGGAPERIARELERILSDYGLDVTSTQRRLQALLEVENTYLDTFQTLGGLGLLLGTVGLALVLARNVVERRRELAVLRALGWRGRMLVLVTSAENVFLLAVGMAAGILSGCVAVAPTLWSRPAAPPWSSLAWTVVGVFAFGAAAAFATAAVAVRGAGLDVLKEDR